jgi:type III pantothenate kinase
MTDDSIKRLEWLGLTIGNSRCHWAWFQAESLYKSWDSEHLLTNYVSEEFVREILPVDLGDRVSNLPIYIASVVPFQTALWLTYSQAIFISSDRIPLEKIYPTIGIDRALALLGAGVTLGFPCLVIDAGTALTFTGANRDRVLVGGAILPGVRLQLRSLATNTAALPEVNLPDTLPERFAKNTQEAIESGVIYTILAGICNYIEDWLNCFPDSKIALTGGDARSLLNYLQIQHPNLS